MKAYNIVAISLTWCAIYKNYRNDEKNIKFKFHHNIILIKPNKLDHIKTNYHIIGFPINYSLYRLVCCMIKMLEPPNKLQNISINKTHTKIMGF